MPFELGIIRNHYVGRTFIEPADNIRHLGVRLKHNANRAVLEGKRVILVDDSHRARHDRRKIVEMVRQAGAREVHMRIAAPPTTHSCFYGIDTPERGKLLAARHDVAEMAKFIGVDSLAFVSIDGLYRAMGKPGRDASAAGLLRRLLHRRLPDPAARQRGQRRPAALAADRERLMAAAARGPRGAGHRREPRHRRRGGDGARRLGAHVVITARTQGGLEETDDAIRALAGRATLLPSTCTRASSSTRSGRACSSGSAGSTSWCIAPARWGG